MARKAKSGRRPAREEGDSISTTTPPAGRMLPVQYHQSNRFAVLYPHGFMGWVSFNGEIHVTPWYQISSPPTEGAFELSEDGTIAGEHRGAIPGVMRLIDVTLILTPDSAQQLILLLQSQIAKLIPGQGDANAGVLADK